MGCTQSSSPQNGTLDGHSSGRHESFPTSKSNPLTEKEIQMRIEAPNGTQVLELGGVRYRYAWMSQRGYYPECKLSPLLPPLSSPLLSLSLSTMPVISLQLQTKTIKMRIPSIPVLGKKKIRPCLRSLMDMVKMAITVHVSLEIM